MADENMDRFTPTEENRVQVVDVTETKLFVVVDLNNQMTLIGAHRSRTPWLLRYIADVVERELGAGS
jgi:hypothetical protein